MNISIKAETIFNLGNFPITNSLLVSIIVTIFLILLAFIVSSKIKEVPSRFQNFIEMIIEALLNFVEGIAGNKGREFFPLIATFFLFIILGNWSGLIPGFGSIGFYEEEKEVIEETTESKSEEQINIAETTENEVIQEEMTTETHEEESNSNAEGKKIFVPLFRGATADVNTTLALALISVGAIQYFAIKHIGAFKFFKSRFLNPIGILEVVSDLSKVFSFAFRLFGNVFAGEVLISVIAFIIPVIAPLPFLGLELFVGFIQALVFSILSLIFFTTVTSEEH